MMDSGEFEPAYLLHHRPYRDSSLVVEFFSQEHGRLPAVARSVRAKGAKSRELAAALQPFQRLEIRWQGRAELKTLVAVETRQRFQLKGDCLYAALYLNELTLRTLHRLDPCPQLWDCYQASVQSLSDTMERRRVESILRSYELRLLEELGYGLVFNVDVVTGEAVQAGSTYQLSPEGGFTLSRQADAAGFPGSALLELSETLEKLPSQEWSDVALRYLKKICRVSLQPLLGGAPLKSRELFKGRQ